MNESEKPGRDDLPDSKKKPGVSNWGFSRYWIYIVLVIAILLPYFSSVFQNTKVISWKEFETKLLKSHVIDKIVVINNEVAEVYIKKEFKNDSLYKEVLNPPFGNGVNPGPHYRFNIGTVAVFEKKLEIEQQGLPAEEKINVEYVKRSNIFENILFWVIPILIFIAIWDRLIKRGMSGSPSAFNFGKSTATLLEKGNRSKVTFDDVAGLDEAKVEVKEIVDFLKEPNAYMKLGAKIPKGVIIVGPPGTGKTLLVKAVAGEADVPFFSISGSEFVEMFVGVGASRVRDLFKRAKEKAPCIIFIDEIDAVGRSRGKNVIYTGANDERESTLNQLLTEMDGFSTNSGVIVLAATNRADMLDPALLRPGRFDRHIYLELPTSIERKAIFKVHLKPLVLDNKLDVDVLAAQTSGCSGADIANICNEAALIAARKKKVSVEQSDFMEAMDRIVAGIERKSKILSEEEKRIVAYHEAGHAVVSWNLEHIDPLYKVSIVPRGKSLGAAWFLPEEHQLISLSRFEEMLCSTLGGRAAEEITFGDVTSGALDDLEKATKMAYTMIAYYGFNKKIGNISFYDSTGMNESAFHKPYSEETNKLIDEEVRKLIDLSYNRTKNLLTEHKGELKILAEMLISKEVVLKEDLEKVLGKRPDEKSTEKSTTI